MIFNLYVSLYNLPLTGNGSSKRVRSKETNIDATILDLIK